MPKVPSALRQGSGRELINVKLIVLSDAGGAISKIRVTVDVRGGAGGLRLASPTWIHCICMLRE
jgi:hypothetical protein